MNLNKLKKELIEQKKSKFKGNIYHFSQVNFAYNSNKIEGGKLNEDETEEIFETNSFIPKSSDAIKLDDLIEMRNHFKLFDYIKNSNGVSRQEINKYMYPLFDTTDENELNNKTRYIINFLRERNLIHNKGTKNKPKWILQK